MTPVRLRVPSKFQIILFVAFALSWFSGLGFFILETFFEIEGDFGPEKHPWQSPALSIHGAAAFAMMICFGVMLGSHIPLGWRGKRLRVLGLSMAGAISIQIVTAYFLYYSANEDLLILIKLVHLIVGAILPILLIWHVAKARKSRSHT